MAEVTRLPIAAGYQPRAAAPLDWVEHNVRTKATKTSKGARAAGMGNANAVDEAHPWPPLNELTGSSAAPQEYNQNCCETQTRRTISVVTRG